VDVMQLPYGVLTRGRCRKSFVVSKEPGELDIAAKVRLLECRPERVLRTSGGVLGERPKRIAVQPYGPGVPIIHLGAFVGPARAARELTVWADQCRNIANRDGDLLKYAAPSRCRCCCSRRC